MKQVNPFQQVDFVTDFNKVKETLYITKDGEVPKVDEVKKLVIKHLTELWPQVSYKNIEAEISPEKVVSINTVVIDDINFKNYLISQLWVKRLFIKGVPSTN